MNKKAQVMTMDLFISVIFFISVFILWLAISNQLINQSVFTHELGLMDKKIMRVSDLLIRTQGLPVDWDRNSVQSIGLAESEYVVNDTKLRNFIEFAKNDPNNVTRLLGFTPYKFFINVTSLTDDVFPGFDYTAGYPLEGQNPSVIISINRFFVINFGDRREPGQMKLMLWR